MLILAGVVLNLALGQKGIINYGEIAAEKTNRETATEKINLKITNIQINKYAQEQRLPTLQELADSFCEDNEIEYVELASKKTASLNKIELKEKTSFFTKLKEYPYEFEINSSLQLASIDGVEVAKDNNKSSLNLESLRNFKQIFEGVNTPNGKYNYKLEKDYSLIVIVVYGIGSSTGSENASANINNSDVIKLCDNYRDVYAASKYATSVTVGYIVNAKANTNIEMSFSYYGRACVYTLGE